MRNISTCYSQHAIKVSDSYCSGPSNQPQFYPKLNPSIQNLVTCIYKAKLSTKKQLFIKLNWSSLSGLGVTVTIPDDSSSPFKVRQSRNPKGTKKFHSPESKIEFFWDLSAAKYGAGPVPINGFSLLVLVDSELCLQLGDSKAQIELRKFSVANSALVSRIEHFSGGDTFSTKAKFCDNGTCHDVSVKFVNSGLWVLIDERNVMQVKRLQWNFRGNQSVFVDGAVVDVMWDVHDWFFNPKSGCAAVLMFRTRSGLDSRLWLEEKKMDQSEGEIIGFSLLISACRNPG